MEIQILGVCGSPIKGGNTEAFLREALKAVDGPGVSTELVPLAGKEIRDCLHCNWCLRKQEEGKPCNQHDDMYEIYPKLLAADGLLLATPVYSTRLSGYLACFLDRFRCLGHGNFYKSVLKNKVGGAMAVSWYRNMGIETTLLSIVGALFANGIIVVSPHLGLGAPLGAGAVASYDGTGKFDRNDRLGVLKDEYGIASGRNLAERMVEVARLIRVGERALKAEALS